MDAKTDVSGQPVPPLFPGWRGTDPGFWLEKYQTMGIERMVLLDPPDITFATAKAFGDFIIPVPQIDLETDSPETIDALFKQGAKGIKLIAPAHPYGDDRYFKHYQAILDNNGLAVFHTGYLINGMFEPGGVLGRKTWSDITHMRPATLDRIARAFPKLKILMAHFGNPWWEEAWKVLSSNANIYADFSGGTAYRRDLEMWRQIFAPNGTLDVRAVSKLCFATDGSPFADNYAEQYQEFCEFYDRFSKILKLPEEIIEKINHVNIENLI